MRAAPRRPGLRARLRHTGLAAGLLLGFGWCASASAQVVGSLTVQNDYQFRGYAFGLARPVAIANLGYDHSNGFYANGSAIGVLEEAEGDENGGPELLGVIGNFGYAQRLSSGLTVEGGVVGSQYYDLYEAGPAAGYAEVYVGALVRGVSARIYYSPDYFDSGGSTLYAEVEAAVEPVPKLRLSARAGALAFVGGRGDAGRDGQIDWSLTASRQFGDLALHASVSGGGPGEGYYQGRPHEKAAIVVGATLTY